MAWRIQVNGDVDLLLQEVDVEPRGWRNEDPEPRVGGGGSGRRLKKKIVTSPILMVEVVVDVPKGTLDGSTGV